MSTSTMKAFIAALAAILMWSAMALLTVNLPGVPSLFLTGSTLLLGGLISLPWAGHWNWNARFIAIGAVAVFLYQFLLFVALRSAPPIECNLINYLWPLFLVLLAPVFDRRLGWQWIHLAAGLMGFIGAFMAISRQSDSLSSGFHWEYLLALAAALTWASYSLYQRRFLGISACTMGLVCMLGGIFALGGSAVSGEAINLSRSDMLIMAIIGIGPLGLSFYLWNYAIKNADPRKIGALSYLAPVLSTVWLSLGIGRDLDAWIIIALTLVVGGAVLGRSK